jgi:quercetin dioxygenase-like cupin family protein
MRRMTIDRAAASSDRSPIFIGEVLRQEFVGDDEAELLRVNAVTFENGARNKLHEHAADQVLIVTDGQGIVANESEELPVSAGDVILIPAGEGHWHGAAPGQSMTHLSILTPGKLTIHE